jgi:hypothetical protein
MKSLSARWCLADVEEAAPLFFRNRTIFGRAWIRRANNDEDVVCVMNSVKQWGMYEKCDVLWPAPTYIVVSGSDTLYISRFAVQYCKLRLYAGKAAPIAQSVVDTAGNAFEYNCACPLLSDPK